MALCKRGKNVVAFLIVAGVLYFFGRAIHRNWSEVRSHQFRFSYPLIALAFATVVAAALLATKAWQATINMLSERRTLSFSESVATVNTSSLTKYLPGKFWSYAMQMYWLSGGGLSRSLILYVNLLNLLISLTSGVILGLVFLLSSGRFPFSYTIGALAALLLADAGFICFHSQALKAVLALFKRFLKRDPLYFDVPVSLLVRLHVIHFLAQLISGVGGFVLSFGIGYNLDPKTVLLVMASLILSDAAGFVVFLVPGGIGVREATMYFVLGGAATGSLAVVFPLVSRMLYMFADALLGAVALRLLRAMVNRSRPAQSSPS